MLLLSAALAAALAFAAPSQASNVFGVPDKCILTATVNWDKISANAAPPGGYGGLDTAGFTVRTASDVGFHANSKPNVLEGSPYGASLSAPNSYFGFAIRKISYACVYYIYGPPQNGFPSSCALSIWQSWDYPSTTNQNQDSVVGPYSYSAVPTDQTGGYLANKTFASGSEPLGTTLGIFITSGSVKDTLVIDSLTYIYPNTTCVYGS